MKNIVLALGVRYGSIFLFTQVLGLSFFVSILLTIGVNIILSTLTGQTKTRRPLKAR